MKTVAFAVQKGGCGKTTSATAVAYNLASAGKKVLLVDMDSQENATYCMGGDINASCTLYDYYTRECSIDETIQPLTENLHLVTGGLQLMRIDSEMTRKKNSEYLLKQFLEPLADDYDYAIIDCPPALLLPTTQAAVAGGVVVPLNLEGFSLLGLGNMIHHLQFIHDVFSPELRLYGILLTKYNKRSLVSKSLEQDVIDYAASIGTKVYKTRIRICQDIVTAQAMRNPAVYGKRNAAANDYRAFTDELQEDLNNGCTDIFEMNYTDDDEEDCDNDNEI